MDRLEALKVLGLEEGADGAAIEQALTEKRSEIEKKKADAPTDALKSKFDALLKKLDAAGAVLSETEGPSIPAGKPAPLSQTKIADLPQAQMSHTGFAGENAGAQIQIQAGQVLGGRYEVAELIATGGMGAVYRAHDRNRGEDIAIKVMLPALMRNERARDRFLSEARLSSQLSHPNIVNVYDVQNDCDLFFITMELLEGQDLRQLMDNRSMARQPFTLEDVLDILKPICAALDHAHEATVHRDIKPENIYLTEDGKYKLMDFGIARVQSTSQRTQTGAASGTAYYMAPEQLKGQSDIDGRADQYALGVLVYELLSGEVPAGAIEPLHGQVKGISRKASDAVQKALSPKPENRFGTLQEFVAALEGGGSGFVMPSLPMKGIGMVAGILLLVLAGGAVIGGTGFSFDLAGLLPMSAEEKAEKKAAIAKIQGQIKVLKQRLETARRNLDSDVRDAERNASGDLPALQHWQKLTENAIFNGSAIGDLEGELSMAETLLREEQFEASQASFERVHDGYASLNENFIAGERIYSADKSARKARGAWQVFSDKYGFNGTSPSAKEAESRYSEAGSLSRSGALAGALVKYQAAETSWKAASGDPVVMEQVNKTKAQWAAAAEERRRKQAAAKAERRRKEAAARAAAQAKAEAEEAAAQAKAEAEAEAERRKAVQAVRRWAKEFYR